MKIQVPTSVLQAEAELCNLLALRRQFLSDIYQSVDPGGGDGGYRGESYDKIIYTSTAGNMGIENMHKRDRMNNDIMFAAINASENLYDFADGINYYDKYIVYIESVDRYESLGIHRDQATDSIYRSAEAGAYLASRSLLMDNNVESERAGGTIDSVDRIPFFGSQDEFGALLDALYERYGRHHDQEVKGGETSKQAFFGAVSSVFYKGQDELEGAGQKPFNLSTLTKQVGGRNGRIRIVKD